MRLLFGEGLRALFGDRGGNRGGFDDDGRNLATLANDRGAGGLDGLDLRLLAHDALSLRLFASPGASGSGRVVSSTRDAILVSARGKARAFFAFVALPPHVGGFVIDYKKPLPGVHPWQGA